MEPARYARRAVAAPDGKRSAGFPGERRHLIPGRDISDPCLLGFGELLRVVVDLLGLDLGGVEGMPAAACWR
jgi:hypothetical protein